MPNPIILPSKTFRTQTAAELHFRKMLNRYSNGDKILDDDDENLLFELIQRHPDSMKIGCGVDHFYRDRSPNHPTACFYVQRSDGTRTDFAVKTCLRARHTSLEQDFYNACRESVNGYLSDEKAEKFSEAGGTLPCEKTGEIIDISECVYRHTEPKFRKLVEDFKAHLNEEILPAMIVKSADNQSATRFSDLRLSTQFVDFHKNRAKMGVFKKFEMP